jgi:hypothetical protein
MERLSGRSFFSLVAPTGRPKTAQGNALGFSFQTIQPCHGGLTSHYLGRPDRAQRICWRKPGALPAGYLSAPPWGSHATVHAPPCPTEGRISHGDPGDTKVKRIPSAHVRNLPSLGVIWAIPTHDVAQTTHDVQSHSGPFIPRRISPGRLDPSNASPSPRLPF